MADGQSPPRIEPIRVRPTLAGWAFLAIAAVVGIAAVRSGAPLTYILFGGMTGGIVFSAVLARRMVGGLRLRRAAPGRAWQNQNVHLGYFLRNVRRRTPCLGVKVEELAPIGIDSVAGYHMHVPARSACRAGGRFSARRRGRIALDAVRIRTVFPFGLVSVSRVVRMPASLVIWPARGSLKRQLLRRGTVESSSAAPSGQAGGQDEFFGLREYRPGDNPRWIHWRKSAGRTLPVLREMTRPLPELLWVIVDTYWQDLSSLGQQNHEEMLRFAATLIDRAFARGYQVGAALAYAGGPAVFPPAAGRGQRRKLLDALADVDANRTVRVEDVLAEIRPGRVAQAQMIVVSADANRLGGRLAALRAACRHLQVFDARHLADVFVDDPLTQAQKPQCR